MEELLNMKMSKKRNMLYIVGGIAILIVLFGIHFYRTQTVWVESEPYQKGSKKRSKTLVVAYSRTGNTLGAAKEVAKYFDADLLTIDAPQYSRDLKGQQLAAKHADEEVTTTPIQHDPVDLNRYDLIFLCSPTWWYRPAIPLFSFVENHDFANKSVFLIMTGNSKKTDEKTGKFETLVQKKNGNLLDVLFVQRGRIYWQKTPEQVNNEVINALIEREKMWIQIVKSTEE